MFNKDSNHAPDFGKISLWIDDRDNSPTCATGLVQLLDEDKNVLREVKVFLYNNHNKKSNNSPDYFGYLTVITESPTPSRPSKGSLPVKKIAQEALVDSEEDTEITF